MTPDAVRIATTTAFALVIGLTLGVASLSLIRRIDVRFMPTPAGVTRVIRIAAAAPFYIGFMAAAVLIIPAVVIASLLLQLGEHLRGEAA